MLLGVFKKKKKKIQSSNSPSPTLKLSKKQFLKLCPEHAKFPFCSIMKWVQEIRKWI